MKELKSNRGDDASNQLAAELRYDASRWIGAWKNTYTETQHIAHLEIIARESKLYIRIFGVCDPAPCDWGLAEMAIFNANVVSHHAEGFTAFYDFGYCETQLSGVEKQNVLVISTYTTYKDNSKRHNYFLREFYHKV